MRRIVFSICIALLLSSSVWQISGCEKQKGQPLKRDVQLSAGKVKSNATWNEEKRPASIEERLEHVKQLCKVYNYKDAYDECDKIVQRYPSNLDGWFWLGFTAHRTLRSRKAKEAYLKVIELNSEYVTAYLNLGILYAQHGLYLKAINYYRVALEKNPNLWKSYAGVGDVYRENAAYNNAIKNYEESVRLNPNDELSKDYLTLCREAQQELDESGVVSARTLKRLANLSITPRWEGLPPPPGITPFQVRFKRGKYRLEDLSENDRRQLAAVAELLSSAGWQGRKFIVEGYTCPCGSVEANRILSLKRAETVKAYLIEYAHMPEENLFVRGYGEENPIIKSRYENLSAQECEEDEEHLMNRRVLLRMWLKKEPPSTDLMNFDDENW